MNCEQANDLIGALRDGELPADERRAVQAHVETCRACRAMLADYDRIGRALRVQGRQSAPPGLADRIRATLERADDAATSPVPLARAMPRLSGLRPALRTFARRAGAIAATCALSVAVTWWVMTGLDQSDRIEREILNAHVRSLLQDSTVQVASSDQHTVRPWFAGRIDFAPAVKDLKVEGFPLAGGRLDYIGERRVGALVYKRNLHVINVFLWPATSSTPSAPRISARHGYNLLSWDQDGVTYWAISDLNAGELRELQRLL